MTSAPKLHRSCVQNGPGRRRVKSKTVMPSRAAGTAAASRGRGINLRAPRISPSPSFDTYGTGGGGAGELAKVEAIRHVIRARIALPQRGEAEVHLAKFQQTHGRV